MFVGDNNTLGFNSNVRLYSKSKSGSGGSGGSGDSRRPYFDAVPTAAQIRARFN
jgi:hypothetical protein